MPLVKYVLMLLSSLMVANSAGAHNPSSSFDVSSSVVGACKIVAAPTLNFGVYDPTATEHLETLSSISVQCTAGSTNVSLAADEGLNPLPTSNCQTPRRQLKSQHNKLLPYVVFISIPGTSSTQFGCTNIGSGLGHALPNFTSSIEPVVFQTIGRLQRGQDAWKGTYSDSVNVTLTF